MFIRSFDDYNFEYLKYMLNALNAVNVIIIQYRAMQNKNTPRQKSIRALEIFRVQKLILNATS